MNGQTITYAGPCFLRRVFSSPTVNFGAFTINFQRVSLKAFPKRADDISRNIEVLKGLMQFLTFAQFGALLYKMLRTQWLKRHDTAAGIADKFNKLKMRAPKIGGRLRPRSKSGSAAIDSGGDLEAAATVVSGDDGAASSTEEVSGAIGSGDKNGVELQGHVAY